MAAETKLNTVFPNNNLKFAENVTPVSEIYVERVNSFGPLENYTFANDVNISLNTFAPGSTATAMLSKVYDLFGTVVLKMNVTTSATIGGMSLANTGYRAWASPFQTDKYLGYSLIQQISIRMPGCERQIFSGENLPYIFLDQCKDLAKREKFNKYSGRAGEAGGEWVNTVTAPLASTGTWTGNLYVFIPLPSTSLDELGNRPKPIPVHLLDDSVELLITFRQTQDVTGSYDLVEGTFPTSNLPSIGGGEGVQQPLLKACSYTINSAELMFRYYKLASRDEYKKVVYKYPCKSYYDNVYPVPATAANQNCQIVLSGMRNGESLGMRIRVASNAPGGMYKTLELFDISLSFAGYTIFVSKEDSHDLFEMAEGGMPTENKNYLFDRTPTSFDFDPLTGNAFTLQQRTKHEGIINHIDHWYHISFSAILEHLKSIHDYQLGVDFNNAEVKLQFKFKKDLPVAAGFFNLYAQNIIETIYQFNGQTASFIQ